MNTMQSLQILFYQITTSKRLVAPHHIVIFAETRDTVTDISIIRLDPFVHSYSFRPIIYHLKSHILLFVNEYKIPL